MALCTHRSLLHASSLLLLFLGYLALRICLNIPWFQLSLPCNFKFCSAGLLRELQWSSFGSGDPGLHQYKSYIWTDIFNLKALVVESNIHFSYIFANYLHGAAGNKTENVLLLLYETLQATGSVCTFVLGNSGKIQ